MIGTFCFVLMLLGAPAFAGWPFKGTCHIDYIKLFYSPVRNGEISTQVADDVPIQPCQLWVNITVSNEPYKVFCFAEGTQLNLALLKAFNADEDVSCDVVLDLTTIQIPDSTCPTCPTQGFKCWIKDIDFMYSEPND